MVEWRSCERLARWPSRPPWRRRHRLGGGRALAAAIVLTMLGSLPVAAVTIELKDVASDRIERQRAAHDGTLALPGSPDTSLLEKRLADKGMAAGSAMFLRVFKAESEVELWLKVGQRYELFTIYPICYWSGTIGPKLNEGDKQNPEGFYTIARRQLHRSGRWPKALNLGFPNALDRAYDRTGSYILMHGGCSSVGCFAMTDPIVAEIFKLAEAALKGGQERIDAHVFPFRMTAANIAQHADGNRDWVEFWLTLKEGYDSFDRTRQPPQVAVCDRRYVVRDTRPGEVADNGPLALCGGRPAARTAAATMPPAPPMREAP